MATLDRLNAVKDRLDRVALELDKLATEHKVKTAIEPAPPQEVALVRKFIAIRNEVVALSAKM